jgi:hypothetical protein
MPANSYYVKVRGDSIYHMLSSTGYYSNTSYNRGTVIKFGLDYSDFSFSRDTFMCSAASTFSGTPSETWSDHNMDTFHNFQQKDYTVYALTLPVYSTTLTNFYAETDKSLFVSGT